MGALQKHSDEPLLLIVGPDGIEESCGPSLWQFISEKHLEKQSE